jgi:tetratricopeptide (TPR) repeat protein
MKKALFFVIMITFFACATNPHATSVKIYMQQQNFAKMLEEAQKWTKDEPNNPEAYIWVSRAYTLNRNYIKGAEHLFKALELGYQKPLGDIDKTTLFNAGVTAGQNKDYDFAIKCLLKSKELEPENSKVYMNLAAFYQAKGESKKAREILEEGHKANPDDPQMAYFLARFYMDESPDKAEQIANENLKKELTPGMKSKFYSLLGEIYTKKDKYEDAFNYFKKAYEADTTSLNNLFNTALSAFLAKKYKDAISFFEKYTKKNPKDASAYEYIGRAYHLLKDYKNAVDYYKKSLSYKETATVYRLLADSLSKLGRTKEAVEALKKAEKLEK